MTTIELTAHVTDSGELTIHLPPDFAGEVKVRVEKVENGAPAAQDVPWEERPWTLEEISELMKPNPVPASQIVGGGWEDKGITDSQAWVEEQRRIARERRENARYEPLTLGDALISGYVGAWEDQGIADAQAWVDEVRRKNEEQ